MAELVDQLNDLENDQITQKESHTKQLEKLRLECEDFKKKAKSSA